MPAASYIVTATAISVGVSVAVNCLIGLALFHGHESVPTWGSQGWLLDSAPTIFLTAMMSSLPPYVAARRALLQQRKLVPLVKRSWLPKNALAIGLIYAVGLSVLLCGTAAAVAVAFSIEGIGLPTLIASKVLIGVFMPLLVTPLAIREARSISPPHQSASRQFP